MYSAKIRNKPIYRRTLKQKRTKFLATDRARKLVIAFVIVMLAMGLNQFLQAHTNEARVRSELESTQQELLQKQTELETKTVESEQQQIEHNKQLEELNQKLQETERALQAKQASKNKVYAEAAPKKTFVATGNKYDWLRASGIPESQWGYVDSIVTGESGWNPNAVNKSSGACGLGQQLPCGKWPGAWNDPVAALKAMNSYVQAYGGWAQAVAFRSCTGWCYSARVGKNVYKDHTWY